MKMKKGMRLVFKNRAEIIVKASNNRTTGMVLTDKQEYSTDFISRWLELGFVKLEKGV